jgi:Ca-activated chloride channel homolog
MFANAHALFLLLLLPLAMLFFVWRTRVRQAALRRIGDSDLLYEMSGQMGRAGSISGARMLKTGMWLVAVAAIILALARPVWGIDESVVEVEGIAVMIVLDVSASMDAQDIQPSRLERSRLVAHDLFENMRGNDLGLILFARIPIVQFPLTNDTDSALLFLRAAGSSSITRQGTDIEEALWLALDTLDERIAAHSVIILLSDGENHEGDPRLPAQAAAARGVPIYTIGYGTPGGAPIPEYDDDGQLTGYKVDGAGNIIQTRLDEEILLEIAEISGGTYQRASNSGIEVINLLSEIAGIEQGLIEQRLQPRPVERFGLFVLLAVVALSLEIFWPEGRRRNQST